MSIQHPGADVTTQFGGKFGELRRAGLHALMASTALIAYCLKIPSSGRFSMIEVEHSTQALPALYSTT
jgi:hypothetical protein